MGDIVTYVLDNGELPIGLVLAVLGVWAFLHYGLPFLRQSRHQEARREPEARAAEQARVQKTTVGDVHAGGNVNISPRQE